MYSFFSVAYSCVRLVSQTDSVHIGKKRRAKINDYGDQATLRKCNSKNEYIRLITVRAFTKALCVITPFVRSFLDIVIGLVAFLSAWRTGVSSRGFFSSGMLYEYRLTLSECAIVQDCSACLFVRFSVRLSVTLVNHAYRLKVSKCFLYSMME